MFIAMTPARSSNVPRAMKIFRGKKSHIVIASRVEFFPSDIFDRRAAQIIESRARHFHLMIVERVRKLPLKASRFRRIETSSALLKSASRS
jgi:hypothetical protein